jgi:hypothetical protein
MPVDGQEPPAQHLLDCQTLTPGALMRQYRGEFVSWRNMKQRCKKLGYTLDPEFVRFRDFLSHVGPKGSPDLTLDRRDNDDRHYGPGRVKWSTRAEQANNRSSTVFLQFKGERLPLVEVATRMGITPAALRKRVQRAKANDAPSAAPAATQQRAPTWPGEQRPGRLATLESLYRARGRSLEAETRAEFYIGYAYLQIGLRRSAMARAEAMVAYLATGALPPNFTSDEMEGVWDRDFERQDTGEIEAAIREDKAFIAHAEALIEEAHSLIPTSRRSPSTRR